MRSPRRLAQESAQLAVDTREPGGAFSVEQTTARLVAYRFAESLCTRATSAWTATMPLPKMKFSLAEHGYHDSIHGLWLSQRLAELGVQEGVDYNAPPTQRSAGPQAPSSKVLADFSEQLLSATDPLLRVVGLYRVLKTHLCVYYRHHRHITDPVADAPTVRVIDHILLEEEAHLRFGQALYEELASKAGRRRQALAWQTELEVALLEAGGILGSRA